MEESSKPISEYNLNPPLRSPESKRKFRNDIDQHAHVSRSLEVGYLTTEMRRETVDDLCYVCDSIGTILMEWIDGRVDVFTTHDNQGDTTCWTKANTT